MFFVGLEGLLVHKIRSILSILGIIFGVASVVAVLSVVGGARKEVLKKMEALGTNNIIVKTTDWGDKIERLKDVRRLTSGLCMKDAEAFVTDPRIEISTPYTQTKTNILIADSPMQIDIFGIERDYMNTVNFELLSGRFISDLDNSLINKVCVIEENLIKEVEQKIVVGDYIQLDHEFFQVIGILKSKDLGDDAQNSETKNDGKGTIKDLESINKRIYIPLHSGFRYISRSRLDPEIDGIIVKVKDVNDLKTIAFDLDKKMMALHGLREENNLKDYQVNIAVDLVKNFESTQNIFNWVLGCSAGISLLVGGIGIMNIMLANISERRKEIGVRLSIGAKQKDILYQFIFESAGLGICGGLIGLVLGIFLTEVVRSYSGLPTYFNWWGALIAIGISLFDAILFGTFPAYKASKLDPVEALHDD